MGWKRQCCATSTSSGLRQRPVSAYAAVIPLFRDFTNVSDVVRANLAAIAAPGERCSGEFYNVSGGKRWSLFELLEAVEKLVGRRLEPRFTSPRSGDVRDSGADITASGRDLGYFPVVGLHAGLRETIEWQTSLARAAEGLNRRSDPWGS